MVPDAAPSRDPFARAAYRRELLAVRPNPRSGLDFLSRLSCRFEATGFAQGLESTLTYVPDRDLLVSDSWPAYLARAGALGWSGLEDLGQAVLGDVTSELMPRWLQLRLTWPGSAVGHTVILEERQPRWDNRHLMPRLTLP